MSHNHPKLEELIRKMLIKFFCKGIVTGKSIISIVFMISSKYISTLQRLNCLLDIFFLLGILLRSLVVAVLKVVLVV